MNFAKLLRAPFLQNTSGRLLLDHVRISKYENIFSKDYTPEWSEEVFVIRKVKNNVPQTNVKVDLRAGAIIGNFHKKSCKRQVKQSFELRK